MKDDDFFLPWPTWAQLSFVLGCGIILVIVSATAMKFRNSWMIRRMKSSPADEVERGHAHHRTLRTSDEVPFGTKAMLEDPDVDGVWNSRTATPLHSPVLRGRSRSPSLQSLKTFPRSRRSSSASSVRQRSEHHQPIFDSPTVSTFTQSTANHNNSRRGSTSIDHDPRTGIRGGEVQGRHLIIIKARSRLNLFDGEGGNSLPHIRPASLCPQRRTNSAELPHRPTLLERRGRALILTGPPPLKPKLSPSVERSKEALDQMESHRKLHSAESGKLQPRGRRVSEAKNLTSHTRTASDNVVLLPRDPKRAVSWPIATNEVISTVNFGRIETLNSPQVLPSKAIVETKPPAKPPPSAWTNRTQVRMNGKLAETRDYRRVTINNPPQLHKGDDHEPRSPPATPTYDESISLLDDKSRSPSSEQLGKHESPSRQPSTSARQPRKLRKQNKSLT